MLVQDGFFTCNSWSIKPRDQLEYHNKRMATYCLENSAKCRSIIQYLTADGRHSTLANLDIIYQDAMTQSPLRYAKDFDELVSNIVYPIYLKRFSERIGRFEQSHTAFKISTVKGCSEYGLDCLVAFNFVESTLNTFYRIFHVLNKEFDTSMPSSIFDWERHYGTTVANMNFQFDRNYEENWQLLKTSTIESLFHAQIDVASAQLQNDLVQLLDSVMPSYNISLTDVLGLIGYSNSLTLNEEVALGKDTHCFEFDNNKTGIENETVCALFDESFRSTCRNIKVLKDLHPLQGLDPLNIESPPCDLGIYAEKWNEYLRSLKVSLNIDSANSINGKYLTIRQSLGLLDKS